MLFYETQGSFGDSDFKAIAKSLFLLDIGNQSYTEYDPADPELIKFMMANPHVLSYKKGHIHSHNNMPVFFSGTDNEELVDNVPFHNFYLSLIVNNKNEMCAKIAFKAKTETETHLTLTFMDEKGKEKKKKLMNTKEAESIYVYKCVIEKTEEAVPESFKARFQEVQSEKDRVLAKAAALKEKALSGTFDINEKWRQAYLFDDFGGSAKFPTGEKKTSVVERSNRVDPHIYSMLTKLLSLDPLYEGTLGGVLKKLNEDFYSTEGAPSGAIIYFDSLVIRSVDFYIEAFPEDTIKMLNFDTIMEKCVEILETYESQFPELIPELKEALSIEIR